MKGQAGIIFKKVAFLIYIHFFIGPIFWPFVNFIHFYPDQAHLFTSLFWQAFAVSITMLFANIGYTGNKLLRLVSNGIETAMDEDKKSTIQRIRMWRNLMYQIIPVIVIFLLVAWFPFVRSKISYIMPVAMLAPVLIQTIAVYVIVPPAQLQLVNKTKSWLSEKSFNKGSKSSFPEATDKTKVPLDYIALSTHSVRSLDNLQPEHAPIVLEASLTEGTQMYVS